MSADPNLTLGSFALHERIGGGSGGDVWRASHRPTGTPAAVKLIKPGVSPAASRGELRAISRLHHPGVVRVYDHGEASTPSGRRAWIAMELAAGTLPETLPDGWPAASAVLSQLLPALAHAHARDVLHRDIKPGNVLLLGSGALQRVALSDFGLAWLGGGASGTPTFMAPEQFRGDPGTHGPWTDLYALGGLVWLLLCGAPVFGRGLSAAALMEAHRRWPLPEFCPLVPVPAEVAPWLARLLQKDPAQRFQCAADAIRAMPDAAAAPAPIAPALQAPLDETTRVGDIVGDNVVAASGPLPPAPIPPLVLPADWRRPEAAPIPAASGLGLLGVADPPLVGRIAERDTLWAALGETVRTSRPRLIVLRGGAGCGKSRLARWLVESAREQGLWGAGLPDATLGVSRPAQLDRWLQHVRRACGARPGVLWLDDVPGQPERLLVVERLLRSTLPVLCVATAGDDALAEAPDVHAFIEELAGKGGAVVPLGGLNPAEMTALLSNLAGLSGEVIARVEDRARGNPLFAVQLVETHRDRLSEAASGFTLSPAAERALPDDLHQAWQARLQRLIQTARSQRTVETAAALGPSVSAALLSACCGEAEAARLGERLLGARLAVGTVQQWRFSSAALQESLLRAAAEAGRLAGVAQDCLDAIGDRLDSGRRGRLLLAAGQPEAACVVLLEGARGARQQGDHAGAMALCALRERGLDQLGVADDDARRARGWIERGFALRIRGRPEEVDALARRAMAVGGAAGDALLLARGNMLLSGLAIDRGEPDRSEAHARDALAHYTDADEPQGVAFAWMEIGNAQRNRGQVAAARATYERAAGILRGLEEPMLSAIALHAAGVGARGVGDFPAAEALMAGARANFLALGLRREAADTINELGGIAFLQGNLPEAEAAFREALTELEHVGSADVFLPRLNLGLVALEQRRPTTARRWLEAALSDVEAAGRRGMSGVVRVCLLCVAESTQEWDRLLPAARTRLEEVGIVDREIARWAERAAAHARERGWDGRADAAMALAASQKPSERPQPEAG